jgi:hypothetical protein
MKGAALKYVWLTTRRELVWFPGAMFAVLVLIMWMMRRPDIRFAIAKGYLGFLVPLMTGIMAAYAVLDDPALELRFATPVSAARTLLSRLALILSVQAVFSVLFQLCAIAMGVRFAPLGSVSAIQLAWIVPTISLAAVGMSGALAAAQCATGAFLAAAVWLVQLLMKSWVLANASSVYLFMGMLEPQHPGLFWSQGVLVVASFVLMALSWVLLHRQERYL